MKQLTQLILSAIAVALFAMAAPIYAAVTPDNVIHACAANKYGDLRIVSSPDQCDQKKEYYIALAPDRTTELCVLYRALWNWGIGDLTIPAFCPDVGDEARLSVQLLASSNNIYDVTHVGFIVLPGGSACASGDEPIVSEIVPVETGQSSFANALFVLVAGDYLVCATPLSDYSGDLVLSDQCFPTAGAFEVIPGETTSGTLLMQCLDPFPTGGLDVIVGFNGPPHISDLVRTPMLPNTCDLVQMVVVAEDPDGDEMIYEFEIVGQPSGAVTTLTTSQDGSATFTTDSEGEYTIDVQVSDHNGGAAFAEFVFGVSECL